MSFNKLKISIITIGFNNLEGLKRTINSVVNQTYSNIEYIVIDGGSSDGSKEVLQEWDNDISYWISEKDTGVYNAMNKGIKAATGSYLLFINSGDVLLHDEVIDQAISFGLSEDLVYGNIVFAEGENLRDWIAEDVLSFETFYYSTLPHPGTFIKRELFEKVGLYNEKYNIVSDWEFFLLATCKYNCSYKHINLCLSKFFVDGISADPKNYGMQFSERDDVLKRHFSFFIQDYENYKIVKEELRKVRKYVKLKKSFKSMFKK